MQVLGLDLTYWMSGLAVIVSVAAATFSGLQWRINARKEAKERAAGEPIVHVSAQKARGNGWILLQVSIQRPDEVTFASIEVTTTGRRSGGFHTALLSALERPKPPERGGGFSYVMPLRIKDRRQGLPTRRTDYYLWFSPSKGSEGTFRFRFDLASSSLPIRHWQKTVKLALDSATISALNATHSEVDTSELL